MTLHDHGYEFIKIGEEGVIDLATYEDSVARNNCSDDLTFNLLSEDEIRDVAYHLHHMVRDWEKRASTIFYSSAHLKMDALIESGVGVAMRQDEIVGFVTLKQLSYRRMSYELLFIKNDAPEETGHFLVNALIHEIKERGFHYFSLGFTPLANVGKSDYSFGAEKQSIYCIVIVRLKAVFNLSDVLKRSMLRIGIRLIYRIKETLPR